MDYAGWDKMDDHTKFDILGIAIRMQSERCAVTHDAWTKECKKLSELERESSTIFRRLATVTNGEL